MAKILISGGNGMLGRALTAELLKKGHSVSWLCRKEVFEENVKVYLWDPVKKQIDLKAFEHTEHLINLVGSNIAGKLWTKKYKQEIFDSRIKSTEFLLESLHRSNAVLRSVCGATATGYYGNERASDWCVEETFAGNDFLAQVCQAWEKPYANFLPATTRIVLLRIGIVLSRQGGMYAKLLPLFKSGLGAVIGKGDNYISWIHIQDLVRLFIYAIEHEKMEGVYNAVSSEPVTQTEFADRMAMSLHRKILLPHLPSAVLRFVLGERATLFEKGSRVKNDKTRSTGFDFLYPSLSGALNALAHQKTQRNS